MHKKRKRDDEIAVQGFSGVVPDKSTQVSGIPALAKEPSHVSTVKQDHEVSVDKEPLSPLTTNDSQPAVNAAVAMTTTSQDQDGAVIELDVQQGAIVARDGSNDANISESPPSPLQEPDLYYYLVKPRTSGSEKVLIPLSPSDIFLTCLQGQTVIEFPTVQVLDTASDALPTGFIVEEQYLARYNKQAHEMEQLVKEEGSTEPHTESKPDDPMELASDISTAADVGAVPNPSLLLATLERDLSNLQQK